MAKGRSERDSRAAKTDVLQGTLDLMVLRTLDTMGPLHGYGIARRLEQISEDALKLNEGTHHDHIVCVDCGRVEEFSDDDIEERQHSIAKRLGFEITDHSLTLHGHCVRENCPYRPKRP